MDPLIYQYIVGGLMFFVGLYFAQRQGYLSGRKGHKNLLIVFGGLLFFLGLQSTLQYAEMTENPSYEQSMAPAPLDSAAAYPNPSYREGKSEAELEHIRSTSQNILNRSKLKDLKKQQRAGKLSTEDFNQQSKSLEVPKLGSSLDYGVMIGYFIAMLLIGTWFGRGQQTTKDFFFGGQRFSWWLIAFSLVATTIGSSSFVKYSKIAYSYGIASSQTYLNDWFWIPLLLFGWLPILYFSKIVSIPEYFARRFSTPARRVATILLLLYLIGYVGINLFTMGQALQILIGWPVFLSAALVASISAVYVTFGGQTSVIMTDLFQGFMLLLTGLLLLLFGIQYLGGPVEFWNILPRSHRMAFPDFNSSSSYPAVGIFWQDAMANSAMFYFLNQGMVMRLMAARSVDDSRKAVITMLLVLMPIAALVVASGGWVGQALTSAGVLPAMEPKESFFIAAEFLAMPGIFGLVMAALTAALMSTVDTLITAISAIVVNDIYKPVRPNADEKSLLKVARISSICIAVFGVLLVPVFSSFGSIYSAHGAFTAAITPPLVVTLLFGVFWRGFSAKAAMITMIGGMAVIFLSVLYPEMITPFAHGVPMKEVEDGFLAGKDQYKFMRAFFGIFSCTVIAVVSGLLTKRSESRPIDGLVWGTINSAIRHYKGKDGSEDQSQWVEVSAIRIESTDDHEYPSIVLSSQLASVLEATEGDLIYATDSRAWLGGLRSGHAKVLSVDEALPQGEVRIGASLYDAIHRDNQPIRIRRMYWDATAPHTAAPSQSTTG